MATKRTLEFEILANTRKVNKDLTKLRGELGKLDKKIKTSQKNSGSMFNGVAKSVVALTSSLGLLGVTLKAVDFANMAADAQQSADAFDRVVTDMGEDSIKVFEEIKAAAQGLIPDAAIKQSATTALSLGVPLSKLAQLMEVARAKSREMGTDAKTAFEDLAKGIGRGSPMILDNLGLTIKLGDANKKMADALGKTVEQLTKEEKTLALTNAVIDSGAESVERYADAALTSKEKMAEMNASLDNLKVKIGEALLPTMDKLVTLSTEWVESVGKEDIAALENGIGKIATAFEGLYKIVKLLNDVGMPDWLVGREDATVLSETALQIQNITDTIDVWAEAYDGLFNADDKLANQGMEFDALAEKVRNFTGTADEFDQLERALIKTTEDTSKLHDEWSNAKNPEAYKDALKPLTDIVNGLGDAYIELQSQKPFEPTIKSADLAKEAVKGLLDATKKLSEEELKALEKLNKQRVKDHTKTLKTLEKDEERLAKEIVNLNESLAKELQNISESRFKTNYDLAKRIREIETEALPQAKQYAAREKAEATALANAKAALKKGEYDKYKTYLDEYETLALASANRITKKNGDVAATQKQTADAKVAILNTITTLENAAYDQKMADAQAAHAQEVAFKKIELEAVKAQLEAEKALLVLLADAKGVKLDTTAIDAALVKIDQLKGSLDSVRSAPAKVLTNTASIDQATKKVEQLRRTTLNGITLEVNADTTPADFGIKKMVTKVQDDEIVMTVNSDWVKAEKQIEDARKKVEATPVDIPVDANTKPAEVGVVDLVKDIGKAKPQTQDVVADVNGAYLPVWNFMEWVDAQEPVLKLTVKVDAKAAYAAIRKLQRPTSSKHTIHVYKRNHYAAGGYVDGVRKVKGFAGGGTFTGSGRVPGDDPTNSDSVNARLTGGEYVIRRDAVKNVNLSFLDAINNMRIQNPVAKFAAGGLVGGAASVTPSMSPAMAPINLNLTGESFKVMADQEVAEALQRHLTLTGGR